MDRLHIFLLVLSGVVSHGHGQISASALEVTVRPGENITLYCDCKLSTGVYIVWYRNCSHENQPPLIFQLQRGTYGSQFTDTNNNKYDGRIFPRFQFVSNSSSKSYDLLIMNITDLDEGLYYCGTAQLKVEDGKCVSPRSDYRYGNVTTRIKLNSSEPVHCEPNHQDCDLCWRLLLSLCPASAALSSLISSLLVYNFCRRTAKKPQVDQQNPESRRQRLNEDEDVCYAALEIRQPSQRPKKKRTKSSDFSTYSAINTSRI